MPKMPDPSKSKKSKMAYKEKVDKKSVYPGYYSEAVDNANKRIAKEKKVKAEEKKPSMSSLSSNKKVAVKKTAVKKKK